MNDFKLYSLYFNYTNIFLIGLINLLCQAIL